MTAADCRVQTYRLHCGTSLHMQIISWILTAGQIALSYVRYRLILIGTAHIQAAQVDKRCFCFMS